MEAAEDPELLEAMRKARIMGALVGIEAVTAEGLRAVFKDFNLSGEKLVERLRQFQEHGVEIGIICIIKIREIAVNLNRR